jgi:calcium-dependent protein kinase
MFMRAEKVRFEGAEWEGVSAEAKDFVQRLLDRDYNSRMSAEAALAHPWIGQHCNEDGCSVANNVVHLAGRSSNLAAKAGESSA